MRQSAKWVILQNVLPHSGFQLECVVYIYISNFTICYIYLHLPTKTLENLFFMAGETPFFPKLPKTINYITTTWRNMSHVTVEGLLLFMVEEKIAFNTGTIICHLTQSKMVYPTVFLHLNINSCRYCKYRIYELAKDVFNLFLT